MMKTTIENNPAEFIENVINSYEKQIENIETVFNTSEAVNDSSHHLFENLNQSITDLTNERTDLNTRLRDNMARNGSMRKNDYDTLMNEVFQALNKLEDNAKKSFTSYIDEQKAMVKLIRENILKLKSRQDKSQVDSIRNFKSELEKILIAQQKGKDLVIENFIRFQNMHNRLTNCLNQMLTANGSVSCKEIKELKQSLLSEIK
jgi:polyribonucleotide nucleotidyltransferase